MHAPLIRAINYALDRLAELRTPCLPRFKEEHRIVFTHSDTKCIEPKSYLWGSYKPYVSPLPSLLAFSNLIITFGHRPSTYPTFIPSLPRFSLPVPHPWIPITVYKSQTPEVPPEAHRVQSLFSLHRQPLDLNRRENGRSTTCSLRSSNHTKFRMITFRHIATSTLTRQLWPTLPPILAAPFPSLARTCCFRPSERASLVRSNLVSICNGEKKSP